MKFSRTTFCSTCEPGTASENNDSIRALTRRTDEFDPEMDSDLTSHTPENSVSNVN